MIARFSLFRTRDPSGVSGIGEIAQGVVFPDGYVIVQFRSTNHRRGGLSTFYTLADLIAVHGHNQATLIHWIDPCPDEARQDKTICGRYCEECVTRIA